MSSLPPVTVEDLADTEMMVDPWIKTLYDNLMRYGSWHPGSFRAEAEVVNLYLELSSRVKCWKEAHRST